MPYFDSCFLSLYICHSPAVPRIPEKRISQKLALRLLGMTTSLFGIAAFLMLAAFFALGDPSQNARWLMLVMFLVFLTATVISVRRLMRYRNNP